LAIIQNQFNNFLAKGYGAFADKFGDFEDCILGTCVDKSKGLLCKLIREEFLIDEFR